uniref:Uncharacterized protein n=1 Tax=viral metagenome TaxID=1070528 RepID=A0A6M3JQ98_9ZZZZ
MRIVEIEFHDSISSNGWESILSVDSLALAKAVGFVKSEDETQVTLVMAMGSSDLIFNRFTIPRAAIISMKELS